MSKSHSYLGILITLSLLVCQTLSLEFAFDLKGRSIECFGESLVNNTLIIGEIKLDRQTYDQTSLRIYDEGGKSTRQDIEKGFTKFSLTTSKDGNVMMCVYNNGTELIRISYEYKVGIEANDYTQLLQKDQIKPIEVEVKKLEDIAKFIQTKSKFNIQLEEKQNNLDDEISSRMIKYSIATIVILLVITSFQSYYMRKFFRTKKLI